MRTQLFILSTLFSIRSAQQSKYLAANRDYKYICGSDPFRFFSEFPCNLYPVCINGGFKLNVGCSADYQCTPYSSNSVCVNQCCCTVPKLISSSDSSSGVFFDSASTSHHIFFSIISFVFYNYFREFY